MRLKFTLNGRPVETEIAADDALYDVLRALHMASVKCGCETGNCGLCTVLLDGKAALSCAVPAPRCEGREVVTLEGMRREAERLGGCLADEGAEQCGFCSPGLMMNVFALAKESPRATDEEMDAYLAGNLCRCSGYVGQRRAIRRYLDLIAGEAEA